MPGRRVVKRPDLMLCWFIVSGVVLSPLYNTALVRSQLIGDAPVGPSGSVAVLCAGLALAWRATLRRGHLRADPAALTWADFDGRRPRVLTRRLLGGWAVRFAAVGYFFVVAGVLIGFPSGQAVFLYAAVAALALMMARRPAIRGEAVLPLVPAVLGAFPIGPLWIFAVVALVAAVVVAFAPSVAVTVSRSELVRAFGERMAERTATAFLDVWALLPAGRPVPRVRLPGPHPALGYVVVGTLARRHALGLPVFLVLAVTAVHATFPALSSVWLLGLGGYLALLPFAAPIAQLHRVPALRRWLTTSEPRLRLTTALVLVVLVVFWTSAVVLLGVPVSLGSLVAVLVAVYAVVRSVTRGPVDFGAVNLVLYEGVLIPTGLVRQLARGPDLLVIGLLICGFLP